jgi:hypothetical protein
MTANPAFAKFVNAYPRVAFRPNWDVPRRRLNGSRASAKDYARTGREGPLFNIHGPKLPFRHRPKSGHSLTQIEMALRWQPLTAF